VAFAPKKDLEDAVVNVSTRETAETKDENCLEKMKMRAKKLASELWKSTQP